MRHAWLAVAAALCSCAVVRTKYRHSYADEKEPGVALVYGYLDMRQAPAPLQRLRVAGQDGRDYYFEIKGGLFYHEALPPGEYKLAALEGRSAKAFLGSLAVWPGPDYALAVPPRVGFFSVKGPGLCYAGSYRYKRLSDFVDAFTIERVDTPRERDVLRSVNRALLADSRWHASVAARLAR